MKIIRVGVDLAKNVFQVHGVDRNEKAVWQRRLKRDERCSVMEQIGVETSPHAKAGRLPYGLSSQESLTAHGYPTKPTPKRISMKAHFSAICSSAPHKAEDG